MWWRVIIIAFLLWGLILQIYHLRDSSEKNKKLELATVSALFLLFFGSALNITVMTANGGKMPVKFFAGAEKFPPDKVHVILKDFDETAKFPFLADIYPHYSEGKLVAISSAGDALINIGFILYIATLFLLLIIGSSVKRE